MPYARKRKRTYTRSSSRRPRTKRSKRSYSSRFKRRRSTLVKALASRRRARNRKLISQYRPGTLSFGNRYVKDVMDGWLLYRSPSAQQIVAGDTSGVMKLQFGKNYCMTPGAFNTFNANNEYTGLPENWEKYASKYQQGYIKYASVTAHFRTQDNRVFSSDPQVTTSTLNPTTYIVGLMISRVPYQTVPLAPDFDWNQVKQLGNCVYKQYTAGVTRSISVTAKVDVAKCLQQYDLTERCFEVMPSANIQSNPSETYPRVVPNENRLFVLPFVVPLTKSVDTGAPYIIEYEVQVRKLCRFTRPVSDFSTIRQNVPELLGQPLYPPIGTRLATSYRPMSVLPTLPDAGINPIDIAQNDRLDDLEGNDNVQDLSIADNAAAISSVDQSLNSHVLAQFPNVH